MNKLFFLVVALLPQLALAQFQGQIFHPNPNAKVTAWGNQKTLAWCGGANNPQFSLADLNNDNVLDLVVYEPYIGVKTFLNGGTSGNPKYSYAPQFEHNFPSIRGFCLLRDYNKDGAADLFQRGSSGFAVYIGRYENKQLTFSYYKDLFYNSVSGWVNAYCEPNDIPGIEDIDHDGDLDFLSYYIGGGKISFYRNCQKEESLPVDSIKICVKDNCWGKTFQGVARTHMLHTGCDSWGVSCKGCPETGNKGTHTGNALCPLDYDGDGDFDYFDGSVSYPDVQLLLNGKADYNFQIDSMLWQDTMWKTNGHRLSMPVWPGGFWLDIDQDNDKDLLFSPTASNTENYKCIAYYKNTGDDNNPVFTYQSDTFLIDKMIDAGTGSYPFFYDYDKDGRTDLFVGSDGYYQPDGTMRSKITLYRNTSSLPDISFELQTNDFQQMGNYMFKGASIAIGDIDDDGKDDLVVGHTDGTLSYFKNMAASASVQPVWNLMQITMKDNIGQDIKVTNYAAPVIYDMDKDGKKDLVIGNSTGYLSYYKGNSTGGTLSLSYVTNKLCNAKADPNALNIYTMSTPYIGRMDNTGVDYLVMGSNEGRIFRFDGFQNGNVTTDYAMIDTNYSFVAAGMRTAPTFADLDGDNKYEMVVGNVLGGLSFYKQLFNVSIDDLVKKHLEVRIYPNPANDMLHINWQLPDAKDGVEVYMISAIGQRVIELSVPAGQYGVQVPVEKLAAGVYYCVIRSGMARTVQPVTISR